MENLRFELVSDDLKLLLDNADNAKTRPIDIDEIRCHSP